MRRVAVVLVACLLGGGCRCDEGRTGPGTDNPPVVVVDPDEEGKPHPVDETEPNDGRARAQALTEDRDVAGRLGGSKDEDWFRVQVQGEGRVLQATVSGVPEGDVSLEAFDETGKRLVRVNNSKEGGGELLVNLTVAPGTYFLRVRAVKGRVGQGGYRIGYVLREREEGEEQEPNWKAELATPLGLDGEATGYLGWHTDTDWYRVDLGDVATGATIRVEFDGLDGVRAGVSLRRGGAVIQERWSGRGEAVVLPNLALPAPDGSDLFVVVRCRYDVNVETRYSLRVLSVVSTGPTELEPNDQVARATPLAADGRSTVAGILADTADRDLYTIPTARPGALRVEAVPPLGLDLALAVVDGKGEVLWEVDAGGAHQPERLPVVWATPPAVLVRVRAPRGRHVSAVTPYHLQARPLEGGDWEREPNDQPNRATPWGGEQPAMKGFVHRDTDVDYYRLGRVDSLALVVQPAAGLALKLDLLLPRGGSVASVTTDRGKEARLETAQAGEFVLKVTAAGDIRQGGEAGYTLRRAGTTEAP